MSLEDIRTVLEQTGYPVAYHHFGKGEVPALPYIVYLISGGVVFHADNAPYLEKTLVRVELYTEKKDREAEKKVRAAMTAVGMLFQSDGEAYIESENMYLNAYESEVI